MKNTTTILLAVILLLSAGTASANPGISVTVTSIKDVVTSGEIAKYEVTVTTLPEADDTESVHLFVNNPMPGWTYTFADNDFDIGPHPDTKTVTLEVGVLAGTAPGTYPQTINASTTYLGITDFETSDFTTYVYVTIPEFPAIALPLISILGMILLISRRKGRGS